MVVFQNNTTLSPDSGNVLLGRGVISLARIDAVTGLPDASGFERMGNVSAFTITAASETIERTNYTAAKAIQDLLLTTSQSANLSIATDEVTAQNFARFLAGEVAANYTSPLNVTVSNRVITTNARKGAIYPLTNGTNQPLLGLDLTGPSTPPTLLVEYDDNANFTSGTPAVFGVDYELNTKSGAIRILPSSAVNVTSDRFWRFTYTANSAVAKTFSRTDILTGTVNQFALRFEGFNGADGSAFLFDLYKVSLSADGDAAIIGDEFTTLTFSGSIQSNPQAKANYGNTGSEFGRIFSL